MQVPFLSYEDIKLKASEVLSDSTYRDDVPVQIELIVENDYQIEIVPIRGLQARYEIDAFISCDLSTISVDEVVLESRINRYRFSLAHELGHRVLHEKILSRIDFQLIDQWKEFIDSIPDKEYGFLEYQASTFANLLLIPQDKLEICFNEAVEKIVEAGMVPRDSPDVCLDYIGTNLSKYFQVSAHAMKIRFNKDNFKEKF